MDRRTRALVRLARWLGPWTSEDQRPRNIHRAQIRIEASRPFLAWTYRGEEEPIGSVLVVPGLHYLGPADRRLDRFCAILADAGLLVLCPFLPEFRALRVGPALVDDTRASFEALLERSPSNPSVLSISFGSYPAIRLAASERHRDSIASLVLFGGYASFEDAIRFSLEGERDRPHDPLNRPVVFLNLLPHLDGVPADSESLRRALLAYVRGTWGKPHMKRTALHRALARSIAARLPEDSRELFFVAVGMREGASSLVERALERASFSHLDVLPHCGSIRAPVTIVHGRDDDVIPHTQARLLADAIAGARLLVTGLYAHTGHGAVDPRALAKEARTLIDILQSLVPPAVAPTPTKW